MMKMNEYDLVVIGGGSAGYAAASTAQRLGLKVAIVEGAKEMGGLCILRGCMPSKTLLESANRFLTIRRASEFGLSVENPGVHPGEIIARKRQLVAGFADYRRSQLQEGRFNLIRGVASFLDPHTLTVMLPTGDTTQIRGRTFLIATGSVPSRVEVPGLNDVGFLGSDEVLESTTFLTSVVILGGGATAVEFAHYYSALGSRVTIIQRSGQLLKEMDTDTTAALTKAFESRGIEVFLNTKLKRVEKEGAVKRVWFEHGGTEKPVECEELIYALGRVPDLDGLALERAGVASRNGRMTVNAHQQTTVNHIFAAGDAAGPFEIVHLAIQQGELAARNAMTILQDKSRALESMDYRLKLFVVFSSPELAAIGMTEKELTAAGIAHAVARYPFDDHGKSLVMGETEGFVKLIVAETSREILGAAVVGPHAADLIHELSAAMYFHATAKDLAEMPHYHPTLSEIWTYPAEDLAHP